MFELERALRVGRNLSVYAVGVGLLVIAALGLANAISLSTLAAAPLFACGLVLIFVVHEYFGGPI